MGKIEVNPKNVPPDLESDQSITLWRYMSFASLCDILMNDQIPLISVVNFQEGTEGAVLKEILKKIPKAHKIDIDRTFLMYCQLIQVSSWHKAERENVAMWERYTDQKEAVAIRTNAKLLLDCIPPKDVTVHLPSRKKIKFSEEEITIKPVEYTSREPSDFEMTLKQLQNGDGKLCFFYKTNHFADEKEIRILRYAKDEKNKLDQCDPSVILKSEEGDLPCPSTYYLKITSASDLIEQIVISPHVHSEFRRMLEDHIEIYNFRRKSEKRPLIDCDITESGRRSWM